MKKLLLVSMVMLMAVCLPTATHGEVFVGGHTIADGDTLTSKNYGIDGTAYVSYIDGVKTLTLDNVTISGAYIPVSGSNHAYSIYIWDEEELNIRLIGENKIEMPFSGSNVSLSAVSYMNGNLSTAPKCEIYGHNAGLNVDRNKLTINYSSVNQRISAFDFFDEDATIAVRDCFLEIYARVGFAMSKSQSNLIFDNAHVQFSNIGPSTYSSLKGNLEFKNCAITNPESAYLEEDSTGKPYVTVTVDSPSYSQLSNGVYQGPMTIYPRGSYPVLVRGERITAANKDDVLGDGKMSFDPATATLTLNGATITPSQKGQPIIESRYSTEDGVGLTVNCVAGTSNNFYGLHDETPCIVANGDLTFTGEGTASFISEAEAIVMRGVNSVLSIDQGSIIARGKRAIVNEGEGCTLTVNGSTVLATSTQTGVCGIQSFNSFIARNSKYDPEQTTFSNGAFYSDGQVLQQVHIMPYVTTYPIKINGVSVTSANCDNIKCPGLESGKISLQEVSNSYVLTLDKVRLTSQNSPQRIIEYLYEEGKVLPLVINCKGSNKLDMGNKNGAIGIYTDAGVGTTRIIGNVLSIESLGAGCYGVVTMGSRNNGALRGDLKIELEQFTTIFNRQDCYSLSGNLSENPGERPTLTFRKATALLLGNHPVVGYKSLSLEGCDVTTEGVAYDPSILAFKDQSTGDEFSGPQLIIEPVTGYGLEIAGIVVDDRNKDHLTEALGLTEGSVTFDPATNTLTMTDAVINVTENYPGILYENGDNVLTLAFSGNSQIRCIAATNNRHGIELLSPLKITGDGWFEVDANGTALLTYGADVTFNGAINTGFFGDRGISDSSGSAVLTMNYSGVYAYGDNAAINGFADLVLKNCMVVEPEENLAYDTRTYNFWDSDGSICHEINIMTTGLPGDVNGDGDVDVTDVVALANHVMGDTPEGFILSNADLNGDGEVDVTDVVALANSVMGV